MPSMAQPHELLRPEIMPDPQRSWQTIQNMSDPQILEYLEEIQRPFSREISVVRGRGGIMLDGEVVLSFRRVYNEPRLFVSRRSDVPLVTRKNDDISAKFSRPKNDDFSTGYLRLGEERVSFIGDKYEIRHRGMRLDHGKAVCDLTILSTGAISDLEVNPSISDYHALLRNAEYYLSRPDLMVE